MSLLPLGPDSTGELLRDLAGDDPSLDGLAELVHERTGGNPFFIEEVVRELVEAGYLEGERGAYRLTRPVEDAGVPATVQAILAARIDRLEPEAKRCCRPPRSPARKSPSGARHGRRVRRGCLRGAEGADRGRLPLRGRDLPGAGPCLQPSPHAGGRLRLPARRAAGHGPCGDGPGADRAQPRAPGRAGGADRPAPGAGRRDAEAARWYARAAHRAGYSHPQDAMRLWGKVTELVDELQERGDGRPGVFSRLLQLDYAWRIGMDSRRRRPDGEAEEIATKTATCAR